MKMTWTALNVGFLALLVCAQTSLFGQVITGTLPGSVLDQSGAVVANATVTVTNEGTGVSNKMGTRSQGFYTFPPLIRADTALLFLCRVFKTTIVKGNLVQVERSIRVDVTLSAGAVNQEVTVPDKRPWLKRQPPIWARLLITGRSIIFR